MTVVDADGRVYAGADAVPPLVRLLPGKRWLGWPWAVPGVARLARREFRARYAGSALGADAIASNAFTTTTLAAAIAPHHRRVSRVQLTLASARLPTVQESPPRLETCRDRL